VNVATHSEDGWCLRCLAHGLHHKGLCWAPAETAVLGGVTGVRDVERGYSVIRSPETPQEVAAALIRLAWKAHGGHYTMDGGTLIGAAKMIERFGENELPACPACGAPAGLDCRTIQGRVPPCPERLTQSPEKGIPE
jgi:hypothetical protein